MSPVPEKYASMAGKRMVKARGLWEDVMVEPMTERVGGLGVVEEGSEEVSRETEVRTMWGTRYVV